MSEHIIKLAAEKNMNKYTFPVVSIKGKPVEYPFEQRWDNLWFKCIFGVFGAKERMLLDFLGTFLLHMNYSKTAFDFSQRIPTSNDNRVKRTAADGMSNKILIQFVQSNIDPMDDIIPTKSFDSGKFGCVFIKDKIHYLKKVHGIRFSDALLKRTFPIFKKYSSKQIFELIKKTSECRFQFNYPIRLYDGKKYSNFEYTLPRCTSRLFQVTDHQVSRISKDNKILERYYEITFDTFLGYFYIQNLLSCYMDLLPIHFYQMSDYAQLFYRLLILPYFNGVKIPISLDEIKVRLVLKSEKYMCRKTILRILQELESNRFISKLGKDFEISKERSYWYQYIKNDWKTITEGV